MSQPLAGRRRTALFALGMVLTLGALLLPAPLPAAAAITCGQECYQSNSTIYYNNAKHSKIVGQCFACGVGCNGETSQYFVNVPACCCGE
jgi:hypothetical protein